MRALPVAALMVTCPVAARAKDHPVSVDLGAEYRIRGEAFDHPTFGIGPQQGYAALDQRFLASIDVHADRVRLFAQLAAAASDGRDPVRRFDRSAPDVQQAFIEAQIGASGMVRLGRQELDGEGDRLIALRDMANLRRRFDLALVTLGDTRPWRFRAFFGRPVVEGPGALDDHPDHGERFAGMTLARRLGRNAELRLSVFNRLRSRATYAEGTGRDARWTVGLRLAGDAGTLRYVLQGAVQRGSFGAARIRAGGIAGELYWQLHPLPLRLGLTGGYASGDARRDDGMLGTFDPLYPNLGYYTDAPGVYPGNSIDIAPQVRIGDKRVTVDVGVDRVWRVTTADAAYSGGLPFPGTAGAPGRGIATLPFAKLSWGVSTWARFTASYALGVPGSSFDGQAARRANFGALSLTISGTHSLVR